MTSNASFLEGGILSEVIDSKHTAHNLVLIDVNSLSEELSCSVEIATATDLEKPSLMSRERA
jgi:hypothetical protein